MQTVKRIVSKLRWRRPGPSRETLARVEKLVREETHRLYGPTGTHRTPQPPPHQTTAGKKLRRPLAVAAVIAFAGATAIGGAIALRHEAPTVSLRPDAAAGVAESPTLAGAPWLYQRNGAPHILTVQRRAALQFPPGTRYRTALDRLMRSVVETGTTPTGATIVSGLPEGVVWQTGTSTRGPRLDLTAPWGYTVPAGKIRTPTLNVSRAVPFDQAIAISNAFISGLPLGKGRAKGLRVDVPRLASCQIQSPGRPHRTCRIQPPHRTGA